MAKFFVGQRVRIVRSSKPQMVGKQATIWNSQNHPRHIDFGEGFYFYLDVDGMGKRNIEGHPVAYPEEYLEPIIDLNQPCDAEFKESLDKLLDGLPA